MTQVKTLREAYNEGTRVLLENNIENAKHDSFALLSDTITCDRIHFLLHGDDLIEQFNYDRFMNAIKRRTEHIPLQHILGYEIFYGHRFKVNEHVLIPRQDTEILVEEALKCVTAKSRILDMCTGSGCILLSLALESVFLDGVGADISEKALEIAEENRNTLQVKNVTFVESDLFETIDLSDKYNLIVSNPPYIKTLDIEELSTEVKVHDPFIALDGYEDGLHFYREITRKSLAYIASGGWLVYEIGFDQADEVSRMMQEYGYRDIRIVKDLVGLDRVVLGHI